MELCIKRLEKEFVQFLPMDQWSSAVNSGALKLFEVEKELGPLSICYQKIRDYDDLLREIREIQNFEIPWEVLEDATKNYSKKSLEFTMLLFYRKSLLEELRALKNVQNG